MTQKNKRCNLISPLEIKKTSIFTTLKKINNTIIIELIDKINAEMTAFSEDAQLQLAKANKTAGTRAASQQ